MKESIQNLKELKELLVVVDMVNGFVKKGSLADSYIEHIIPEQIRLIEEFLKAKQGVLFIKDAHTKDSKEFDSFPPHCIKGTEEAELVDELKPYEPDAMCIEKKFNQCNLCNWIYGTYSRDGKLKKSSHGWL